MNTNIIKLAEKYERIKQSTVRHSALQMTDNTELVLEGCSGVLEYNENVVKILLIKKIIIIIGHSLEMNNFSTDGITIKGNIRSIAFDDILGEE